MTSTLRGKSGTKSASKQTGNSKFLLLLLHFHLTLSILQRCKSRRTSEMLDANSGIYLHRLQNVALIVLHFFFLPLDTLIVLVATVYNALSPARGSREGSSSHDGSHVRPKNILVTGIGMSKGLTLARLFYQAGHNVVGADFSNFACGRFSKAISRFYRLFKPDAELGAARYIDGLLKIVSNENIDLWVSCSGVASAVEDGEAKEIVEARTTCKAIQFDVSTTQLLHEKHTFIEYAAKIGLVVPETHTISNSDQAVSVLTQAGPRQYIMKPIGMDDANRGDLTLLPKSNAKETSDHVSRLNISEKSPWILQQYIDGPEFCTHALVIKSVVKAFVACRSAELLMHYEALPTTSKLYQKMLDFTCRFAASQGSSFTGHLSFDFMVDHTDAEETIYPIECNPRAHTADVLFNGTLELADAYLSVLELSSPTSKDVTAEDRLRTNKMPLIPQRSDKYFWTGHDLVALLLYPVLSLILPRPSVSFAQLFQNAIMLVEHLIYWRDGTFERWDPLPWFVLYHLYWPVQFWNALRSDTRWSRVNVSTTKMFQC